MDSQMSTNETAPLESLGAKSVRERMELVVKEGSHAKVLLMLRELKRTLETPALISSINRGILNYIYATGALAFACKDINGEAISRLLLALRIEPEEEMIEIIRTMHYKGYSIYLNVDYFMLAVGLEPTIESLISLLRAMDHNPDATVAGYTIEYFKEFNSGKVSYNIPEPEGDISYVFNKMADMAFSLSNTIANFAIHEIERIVSDEHLKKFPQKDLLPYFGAIGLLTFSGKDVDRESIGRIIGAMGMKVDEGVMESIAEIEVRSHIVYIVALYFINAVGPEPTLNRLIDVVKAMDIVPDPPVAGSVISFYKMYGLDSPDAFAK
jgi:ribosomal protein L12E/L44/L45/RPP1/RPP2